MKEIWKTIPSFPLYEASTLGQVRSKEREVNNQPNGNSKRVIPVKVHSPKVKSNGYLEVSLAYAPQKSRSRYVHRLVAETFITNPENKKYINHKDGDKNNNCIDNLEWCTASENLIHSFRVLGRTSNPPKGEKHSGAKVNKADVVYIRFLREKRNYQLKEIAEMMDVHPSSVGKIARYESWKHI